MGLGVGGVRFWVVVVWFFFGNGRVGLGVGGVRFWVVVVWFFFGNGGGVGKNISLFLGKHTNTILMVQRTPAVRELREKVVYGLKKSQVVSRISEP